MHWCPLLQEKKVKSEVLMVIGCVCVFLEGLQLGYENAKLYGCYIKWVYSMSQWDITILFFIAVSYYQVPYCMTWRNEELYCAIIVLQAVFLYCCPDHTGWSANAIQKGNTTWAVLCTNKEVYIAFMGKYLVLQLCYSLPFMFCLLCRAKIRKYSVPLSTSFVNDYNLYFVFSSSSSSRLQAIPVSEARDLHFRHDLNCHGHHYDIWYVLWPCPSISIFHSSTPNRKRKYQVKHFYLLYFYISPEYKKCLKISRMWKSGNLFTSNGII